MSNSSYNSLKFLFTNVSTSYLTYCSTAISSIISPRSNSFKKSRSNPYSSYLLVLGFALLNLTVFDLVTEPPSLVLFKPSLLPLSIKGCLLAELLIFDHEIFPLTSLLPLSINDVDV